MYYCQDCGKEFRKVKVIIETHDLPSEPYERYFVCPHCHSTNIKERPARYCGCCGARMTGEGNYCSDTCRRRGEYLWAQERNRREAWAKHPLNLAIKQVEEYNKEHGTNLSYGQYFAKVR